MKNTFVCLQNRVKKSSLNIRKTSVLLAALLVGPLAAEAQNGGLTASYLNKPTLTYDLGGSVGSYNNYSYSEINLGLNYYLRDWLNWRNSVFTRFGDKIDSVVGLDSGLIGSVGIATEGRGAGIEFFAGPGVRFASRDNSAVFGQVGVVLGLGGLQIGVGAKSLYYMSNRRDPSGADLAKNDTQYFIILAGGGAL